MITDYAVSTPAAQPVRSDQDKNRKLIRWWLYSVFIILIAIVMVGGATRTHPAAQAAVAMNYRVETDPWGDSAAEPCGMAGRI